MRTVTPLIFFTLLACENKDAVVVDTTESLPATDSAAPVDADGDGVPATAVATHRDHAKWTSAAGVR